VFHHGTAQNLLIYNNSNNYAMGLLLWYIDIKQTVDVGSGKIGVGLLPEIL
jgi:hypothetical protein